MDTIIREIHKTRAIEKTRRLLDAKGCVEGTDYEFEAGEEGLLLNTPKGMLALREVLSDKHLVLEDLAKYPNYPDVT